jgi:hypothetical protein
MPKGKASNATRKMMTHHAADRMMHRGIRTEVIELVMDYGRMVFTRGAMVFAVGRKEIQKYLEEGIDLSICNGVHIVCSINGAVLTVYRNRSLRGLRAGLGRGKHQRGNG